MALATIDIDTYHSLSGEGIETDIFVGQNDDPTVTTKTTWHSLVCDQFDIHTIPTKGCLVYGKDAGDLSFDELLNIVSALRDAADLLETKVVEADILMRDEWVEAGMPSDAEPFTIPYIEYLNKRHEKGEL